MTKYTVYAAYTAMKALGTVWADTPEEAVEKACESVEPQVSLCWQCSEEVELSDVNHFDVADPTGKVYKVE